MRFHLNQSRAIVRIATALAVSLLASLAGCGGGDAPPARQIGFDPISCSDLPSPCA